jgi:histone acetyltransferase 1
VLQFYIDGASFIDPDDPNWHYFVCYLDNKVVGYTSVLENKTKAKSKEVLLSQFIILPPYQGLGLGGTFLKIVYDHYLKTDKQCFNFSVEEPSDEF